MDQYVKASMMENSLQRFIDAQNLYGDYDRAREEMAEGRKTNHWIWFIFPQIQGLGRSPNARYYALDSLAEAERYLNDPVLGVRLREMTNIVLGHKDKAIDEIMGSGIDVRKFRSSMTLFDLVSPGDLFGEALDVFFNGDRDARTIAIVQQQGVDSCQS